MELKMKQNSPSKRRSIKRGGGACLAQGQPTHACGGVGEAQGRPKDALGHGQEAEEETRVEGGR